METSNRGRWFWLGAVAIMVLITAQIDWDWLWFPALISNASSTVLIQLNNRISQEGLISIIVVDPAENGSKIGHMQIKAITQIRSKISLQRPTEQPFRVATSWRWEDDNFPVSLVEKVGFCQACFDLGIRLLVSLLLAIPYHSSFTYH